MISYLIVLGTIGFGASVRAEEARPPTGKESSEVPGPVIKKSKTYKRSPYNPKVFIQKKSAGRATIGGIAAEKIESERDGTGAASVTPNGSPSKVSQAVECNPEEQTAPCTNGAKNCPRQLSDQVSIGNDQKTTDTVDLEPPGQDIATVLMAFIKNNCRPAKSKEKRVAVEVGVSVSKIDETKNVQVLGPEMRKQVGTSLGVRTKF